MIKSLLPRLLPVALLLLLLVPAVPATADEVTAPWAGPGLDLFHIDRSTNANRVQYRVGVTDDCRVDPARPLSVYWRRLQKAPDARSRLKWVEQKFAFGVDVHSVTPDAVSFTVAADPKRAILARVGYDDTGICVARAWTPIRGEWTKVDRVYVMVKERRVVWPKVLHVDLYGWSRDGRRRCDRILDVGDPAEPCPVQAWWQVEGDEK